MRLEVTTQVQLKLPAGSPPGTGLMMSSAGKLILKVRLSCLLSYQQYLSHCAASMDRQMRHLPV
jgi:hypothetical protein